MKQQLAIENIVIDRRFQSRVKGLDNGHVEDLMEAYERADSDIDCPRVWNLNGLGMVLTRGFHRIEALKRLGRKRVEVEVKNGDVADALVDAAGSNSGHGLKRTNADKRRCVDMVLEAHPDWSSRRVAEEAGVSDEFVRQYREEVEKKAEGQVPTVGTCENKVTGRDGKKQSRRKKKDKVAASPEPVKQSGNETDDKSTNEQSPTSEQQIQASPENVPVDVVAVVESVCREIDKLNRQLDAIKKEPLAYPVHFHSVQSALRNARETLWMARPVFVDPYCKGTGRRDGRECQACRGTGKVIKSVNTQAERAVGPVGGAA